MSLNPPETYRRNLPHIQHGRSIFTTFTTRGRMVLPPEARDVVYRHCTSHHLHSYVLHAAVVMPDHVHLVFTPTGTAPLARIMQSVKGASAREVNLLLGRRGQLWEHESFDRALRVHEDSRAVAEYVVRNPAAAGLGDAYPWVWKDWLD